ncbi:hypothetical protein SB759_29725, partial [Pseudomonas sp. SIMBA_059]
PVSTQNFHSKAHPMACFAKADVSEPALIDAMIVITKIESAQSSIYSTQFSRLPSLPASELSC